MSERPRLNELAAYCDVLPEFRDWQGQLRSTGNDATVAVLAGMGLDAATESSALRALRRLREEDEQGPDVAVLALDDGRIDASCGATLRGQPISAAAEITFTSEDGRSFAVKASSRVDGAKLRFRLEYDGVIDPGYYDAEIQRAGYALGRWHILARPGRCVSVRGRSPTMRSLGVMLNVYTLRSASNWGVGDLSDVARVATMTEKCGTGFVGMSPLHATANRGGGKSPYYPSSRVFLNWLYVDVEAVPEFPRSRAARSLLARGEFSAKLANLRTSETLDYEALLALKREMLEVLFEDFLRMPESVDRRREFAAYCREKGKALADFATYEALAEKLSPDAVPAPDWRSWPEPYRRADGNETAAFARKAHRRIDFHRWLQFETERQLAAVATARSGLGLFCDLAVGTAPGGAETWACRDNFAEGVELGAPPDDYSVAGQSWGLTPLLPRQLRRSAFHHFREIMAANFRHAGALRLDHAMGLVRQFWVPSGEQASKGAYVAFPADEMFAILAIESVRADCVVVAEDLGTVPEGFREDLRRYGCLRTQVLYFEKNEDGEFRRPGAYAPNAFATVNTHDLPPLGGFWRGVDIERRARFGALPEGQSVEAALAQRARDKAALARCLVAEGLARHPDVRVETLCAATTRFLVRTPAALVGVSLDDLGGEYEPVNVPGLPAVEHGLWSRRMQRPIEDILRDPEVVETLSSACTALVEPPADARGEPTSDDDPLGPVVNLPIDGCLDLHTFRPRDVGSLIEDYLEECRKLGVLEVRVVHGKGRGVLRRTVLAALARLEFVADWRGARAEEGGWGATVVRLRPPKQEDRDR